MASNKPKPLHHVFPEKCSDKNIVGSVFDFINDYIPTSGPHRTVSEEERVLWTKFEDCTLNELEDDGNQDGHLTLVILLGTTRGFQIWSVPPNGEAVLLYCQRGIFVQCAKLLPTPDNEYSSVDSYGSRRPIIALCENGGSEGLDPCALRFLSLRNNEDLRYHRFTSVVHDINSSKRFIVVTRRDCLTILSVHDLQELFTITNCRVSNEGLPIPTALGERWLAFMDMKREHQNFSEGGDTSDDGSQPIATTVMNVKNRVWSGLSSLSSSLTGSSASNRNPPMGSPCRARTSSTDSVGSSGTSRLVNWESEEVEDPGGIVTVVDLVTLTRAHTDWMNGSGEDLDELDAAHVDVHRYAGTGALVAHFQAHRWASVASLAFDPAAVLILSACTQGHAFHVFRISAHPFDSRQTSVHHLYTLHRGETPCAVVNMTVSRDSRWVAVSSNHGTTHLFPITPYGGPVTVRTHTQPRVVNRSSRWHKSAGIEEIQLLRPDPTRADPVTGGEGRESPAPDDTFSGLPVNRAYNCTNPRLPPYPQTCIVKPELKLKQQLSGIGASSPSSASGRSPRNSGASGSTFGVSGVSRSRASSGGGVRGATSNLLCEGHPVLPLVARFATSRCFLPGGSVYATREKDTHKKATDSIFVMNSEFRLFEYELNVVPAEQAITLDRVCQDGPVTLENTTMGQWRLQVPMTVECLPPFGPNHPLLTGTKEPPTSPAHTKAIQSGASSSPVGSSWSQAVQYGQGSSSDLSSRYSSHDSLASVPDAEGWVSQVEIHTHMGPHRRLWMGPQFSFRPYQDDSGVSSGASVGGQDTSPPPSPSVSEYSSSWEATTGSNQTRSGPVSMPSPGMRTWRTSTESGSSADWAPEGRLYIEAGSYQDSSLSGSLSSLAFETTADNVAQSIAEAMLEETTSTQPRPITKTASLGRGVRPPLSSSPLAQQTESGPGGPPMRGSDFLREEDFPSEEERSLPSGGSSPVLKHRRNRGDESDPSLRDRRPRYPSATHDD